MKKVVEVLRRIVQMPVPGPTAHMKPLMTTYVNTLVSMEDVMLLWCLTARKPAAFVNTMKLLDRHVNRMLEFVTVSVKTSALLKTLDALCLPG